VVSGPDFSRYLPERVIIKPPTLIMSTGVADIAQYDAEIEVSEQQLVTLRNQLKERENQLSDLKSSRNSVVSISQLPNEILCGIFKQLGRLESFYPHKNPNPSSSITASHVCRHWRRVAIDCAELWSYFDLRRMPCPWTQDAILRSKQAPISISHGCHPGKENPLLLSLLSQTDRLSYVSLRWVIPYRSEDDEEDEDEDEFQSPLPSFLEPLQSSAPLLRDLEISSNFIMILPQSFLNNDAPLLRTIDLDGCFLPWHSGLFQSLTTLHLNFFGEYSLPNPPEPTNITAIMSALTNSPQLESLRLHLPPEFIDIFPNLRTSGIQWPAEFPLLESLDLRGTCETCASILEHMRLPSHLRLELDCSESDEVSLRALAASILSAWTASPLEGGYGTPSNIIPLHSLDISLVQHRLNRGFRIRAGRMVLTSITHIHGFPASNTKSSTSLSRRPTEHYAIGCQWVCLF